MREYYYRRILNPEGVEKVRADSVEFSYTHIVFRNSDGSLNVAIRASDVLDVWEDSE